MIHRLIFKRRAQLIPEGAATTSSHSIIRVAHNHHKAGAVVHAVVTDASKLPFPDPARGAEAAAAHDQDRQAEALGLKAEAFLHVVVLDVDLEGDLRDDERLREVMRLGGGEGVEVLLPLLLGLLGGRGLRHALGDVGVGVFVDGDWDGAPIGTVEHGGGADVQQPPVEVVLDGPLDGEGGLVGEVDGDADAAERRGLRGGGRGQGGSQPLALPRFAHRSPGSQHRRGLHPRPPPHEVSTPPGHRGEPRALALSRCSRWPALYRG